MAIINSYPLKNNYYGGDKLVLSDMEPDSDNIVSGDTKNITLSNLKQFVGSQVLNVSASTDVRYAGAFVSPSIGNVKVGIDISSLPNLLASNVNGADKLIINSNQENKKLRINELFETVGLATNSLINYSLKLPNSVGGPNQVLQLPSTIGDNPHQLEWSTPAGSGTVVGTGTIGRIPRWQSTTGLDDSEIFQSGSANIGIGTTGPSAKLQVNAASGTTQAIIGYGTQNLYVGVNGTNVDLKSSGSSAGTFSFSTGNNERIRITSTGSLGIGTTAPGEKLEVTGKIKATGTADVLQLYRNSSSQANYIKFYDNATSSPEFYLGFTNSDRDFQISNLAGSGTIALRSGGVNTMLLDSSQRVGIGTTTPDSVLTVKAANANVGIPVIKSSVSGFANGFTLIGDNYIAGESQLNLGISYSGANGVLSRGVKVSNTTDDVFLSSQDAYSTNPNAFVLDRDGSFRFLNTSTSASTPVGTTVNLSERMRILSNGNVGIGTTAPNAKLHIQDTSGSTSFIKISAASANSNFAFLKMFDNTVNTAKLYLGTTFGYNVQKPALELYNGYTSALGDGTNNGRLRFNCSANSHYVEVVGPNHSGGSSYSLKLPNSLPNVSNQILESNSSGTLSWIQTPSGGGYTSWTLRADDNTNRTIVNGAVVNLVGGTGITTSTNNPAQDFYVLSADLDLATSSTRGGVKIGYTESGKNYPVELSSEKMFVNVPWTDTVYSLPEATSTVRGGIELFSNTTQSIEANTVTTTANRTYGIQLNSSGQAVVNVPWTSGGSGGISWNGSTSDGLATYSNSSTAKVNSQVKLTSTGFMTFDGQIEGSGINYYSTQAAKILRFGDMGGDAGTVELWTDGERRFEIGVNGEIGLGTGASQGTSGQVLTSQGNGSPATWSSNSGGQNIANTNLTQTANRTYAMGQYALTITGSSTVSMQNTNGLVANGNIISNSQMYAAKNSISNQNSNFTIDCNNGNVHQVNLTNGSGNVVISFSNIRAGARYTVIVTRLGFEGTYGTYSFNSVLWPNSSTPQNVPAGSGTFNMYEFVATTTAASGMLGYFFRNYQAAS